MRSMKIAVEWLRPCIENLAWDYCVVWKLGDEHSRGGARVKVERGKQELVGLCRDERYRHNVRSKACEALAHFPLSMSLYSGIHGDVVISKQPRWISYGGSSDSKPSNETTGTRVLIPVLGGLIELFAAKNTPKDVKIIELITSLYDASSEQEMTAQSYMTLGEDLDPPAEANLQNLQPVLRLPTLIPKTQVLTQVTQSHIYPSFDGSSSSSHPPSKQGSFDSNPCYGSQNEPLKESVGKFFGFKRSRNGDILIKQQAGVALNCNVKVARGNSKAIRQPGSETYQSKNLVTERNRRNRIKDGLFALRAIVPKISKMDRAAIIGDAIEYIGELQKEIKRLQDELKKIEDEEHKLNNTDMKVTKSDRVQEDTELASDQIQSCSGSYEKRNRNTEMHVEVNRIGEREFLIKFLQEHKRGGFGKLMDALQSLDLFVVNANITTYGGNVLNILQVEANKDGIQPKKLKDSLINITSSTKPSTK
ncbi:transcription factor bHLH90 isoform X2 [Carica papaya]|uniref:transcription factor bHLH90 isoform X2 n=1 Tax=Carica papaya TaxID=3649 RepID=UPI000B8CB0F2|nr:transcription factor bHLH90 isoform X2 [Carica papaya]